jgi:predicted amidohydrolase YtcJ
MTTTLYRGGHIDSGSGPGAGHARPTAMLVTGAPPSATVAWIGTDADAPRADETVDLAGALVTPAFVDAHVHATATGVVLTGFDLTAARSARDLLDAVATFAATLPAGAVVLGHGWDESTWADQRPPTAAELDRAAAGRMVYLTQASAHSALCSTALIAAAPAATTTEGYDESGWLREQADHVVREIAYGSIKAEQRRAAQVAALCHAASLGIAAVHECGGPATSSEADFTALLALAGAGNGLPEVYGYWGELMAAAKAKDLGALGAGGDLYADGALGSRTAHLREPYRDGDPSSGGLSDRGYGFVSAEQVAQHVVDCARHGVQAGFHAIGDRALGTVLAGYRVAAAEVGLARLRAGRHRIEHVELVDAEMIASLVELGIVASMQPTFDRLWGGEKQMYAQRLGVARSLETNPMGAMRAAGVALAFGSDSPVTSLDPWGSVRAAMWHFNPAYRMTARDAFAAHSAGGWQAAGQDGRGTLAPGADATFAVWSTPAGLDAGGLPVLEPSSPLPRCRRTVLGGTTIFLDESREEA